MSTAAAKLDYLNQKPRTASKGERTRLAILEAAIRAIARDGFDDASFGAIADAAGVSRPLVTHYFPTKERLLDEALPFIAFTAQGFVETRLSAAKDSPLRALYAYVEANLDWAEAHPHHLRLWLMFLYRSTLHPKWARLNRHAIETGETRIRALLEAALDRREIRPLNLAQTTHLLHRMLYGAISTLAPITGSPEFARQKRISKQSLRAWIESLA